MLDTDSLILAVSNHNPLSKKSIVTLEELKKQRLILRLPDSATRNLFISHLESNNVSIDELNVTLEVDNVATIDPAVETCAVVLGHIRRHRISHRYGRAFQQSVNLIRGSKSGYEDNPLLIDGIL